MSECCTASKWQRQDLNPRSFLYRIWLGRLEERFEVRAGKEFHGVHSSRKVCESVDTASPCHPSWGVRAEVPAEGDPTPGPPPSFMLSREVAEFLKLLSCGHMGGAVLECLGHHPTA